MVTKKGFEDIAKLVAKQFLCGNFENENIDAVINEWCKWGNKENPNFNNSIFENRIKEYIKKA